MDAELQTVELVWSSFSLYVCVFFVLPCALYDEMADYYDERGATAGVSTVRKEPLFVGYYYVVFNSSASSAPSPLTWFYARTHV